jgi:hypothetical protein
MPLVWLDDDLWGDAVLQFFNCEDQLFQVFAHGVPPFGGKGAPGSPAACVNYLTIRLLYE